ncbi:hypothetical protein EZY14_007345 [Kordia sp. TARA_039_SRF]|nr:hypothetical protein EZY14_007345 [Kordia sp. TARA_039_SRF]
MKNIISIICGLFTSLLFAQEQIVPLTQEGILDEEENIVYYYKDINGDLNKFLGTWKYQDATKELIVTFYLNQHVDYSGSYSDEIYARFKYTENGTIIYNTLNSINEDIKHKISGGSIFVDTPNKVSLTYFEPTNIPYSKSMTPTLNLEYLPCTTLGCNPQLKWDIFWASGRESDPWPFKIPSHLTLTKQ